MKIFILNPPFVKNFCRSARWAAVSRGRVQRHPDWLLLLAGMLKKHGHQVEFIDGPVAGLNQSQVVERIAASRPDMFVCHVTTPSIYNDLEYCRLIKDKLPQATTIVVGAHASALPEETLDLSREKYDSSVDAAAVGEYEWSITEAAGDPKKLGEIRGLATKSNGVFKLQFRPPEDVNELAFPAWDLIKPEDYRDAGKRFPFLTMINARGCIGSCIFCRDKHAQSPHNIRSRRVDLVVDEIKYDLDLYPQLQEIMFETDNFGSVPEYTEELCKAFISSGISKRIPWSLNTRVDISLDLLPLMKKAGARMLMVGFEFGSQETLDAVNKGTTIEQARKFANRAHELGFIIHGCFMIGAPGENEATAQRTIDFAKSLPCDTVQFSGLCPYPGTPLYRWAKEKDYLIPKDWTEWVSETYEQCTLLSYPDFTSEKIDYYIDKGLKEFYLRPSQVFKMLLNIRSFADVRRKLFGLKNFLDYFKKS